jgi:Pyruvate/2-oxoacid:ferredoxin oxidoreductase gamma subunit
MENKKISTTYGTIIIVVITVMIGALVWIYEKDKPIEQSDIKINQHSIEKMPSETAIVIESKNENIVAEQNYETHKNGCDLIKNFEKEKWFSNLNKLYKEKYIQMILSIRAKII